MISNSFPEELIEFLRIPSISTQPEHESDILKAAEYLVGYVESIGVDNCQIINTEGYPVVYGEKIVNDKLPTVLVYGHYDVQPADSADEWISMPFEPAFRKTELHPQGALFARGACDDKGQLFIPLKAFEYLRSAGSLPCNFKFIFEGEEEIGSVSLPKFIGSNKELLKSEALIVCDTAMIDRSTPALIYKLKGAGLIDMKITTKNPDLHSGIYGGVVPNPATELCKVVTRVEEYFQQTLNVGSFSNTNYKLFNLGSSLDVKQHKNGLSHNASVIAQHLPTMEINGVQSGYCGKGHKTVIPNTASVKISVRSAVGEGTQVLLDRLISYVNELRSADFQISMESDNLCEPVQVATDSPEFIAAKTSLSNVFGNDAVEIGIGGSIPIVQMFKDQLNLDSLLMGFGLNSDDIHSANEHFGLENFNKGVATYVQFFEEYAKNFDSQQALVTEEIEPVNL